MSPYRSFTTSGCFARFSEPAVGGDDPAGVSSKMAQAFRMRKPAGSPSGDGGAIPFDTRNRRRCLFRKAGRPSLARRQQSARYFSGAQALNNNALRSRRRTVLKMVARGGADRHAGGEQSGAVAPD
jgi:isochorismate synthase